MTIAYPNVDPTGQSDAAFVVNNALATGVAVLPSGNFNLMTVVNVPANAALLGPSSGSCIFNGPGYISITGNNATVSGLTLNRGSAVDPGIQCVQASQDVNLEDIIVSGGTTGFSLGPSYYGIGRRLQAIGCLADGFQLFNTAQDQVIQWNLSDTLAERCGGLGYRTVSNGTYGTCGLWTNTTSFQNTLGGAQFLVAAAGCTLNDVRLTGLNLSTDGGHELVFDTHGEHNMVNGGLIESGAMSGIVALNNFEVTVANVAIRGHQYDGIGTSTGLKSLIVQGCQISANNQGNHGSNGITIGDPNTTAIIASCSYGAPQVYSLWSNSRSVNNTGSVMDRVYIAP
jgi:hypothetical protein